MKYDLRKSNLLNKLLSLGVIVETPYEDSYRCGDWNLLGDTNSDNWGVWDSDKAIWVDVESLEHIELMARKMIERSEPWP